MTVRKPKPKTDSGSPSIGEPEYLLVGTLSRPHGVHGEILMRVETDFPDRLVPGTRVYIGARQEPYTITGSRGHSRGLIVRLEGVDSPESAGLMRSQAVYVPAANRPTLPEGMYYHHQLLGSKVVDIELGTLGTLNEILQTGANDVYVVRGESGREVLLPAIPGVILSIDARARTIRVRVPEGIDAGMRP